MSKPIEQMAIQAGLNRSVDGVFYTWNADGVTTEMMKRLEEIIRKDEREACAITAWSTGHDLYLKHHDIREVGSACATAIRARGEK